MMGEEEDGGAWPREWNIYLMYTCYAYIERDGLLASRVVVGRELERERRQAIFRGIDAHAVLAQSAYLLALL